MLGRRGFNGFYAKRGVYGADEPEPHPDSCWGWGGCFARINNSDLAGALA
jgi:hypothetical protein